MGSATHPGLQIVAAMDPEGVIGVGISLPWHLPDDLRHFRRLTLGHTVIMGRRTLLSIGKALPRRRNLVLSRRPGWSFPGTETCTDLESAVRAAGDVPVFVIGGAQVFRAALPRARVLHRTLVHERHAGDVRFPPIGADWQVVWEEEHAADECHASAFTLQRLER